MWIKMAYIQYVMWILIETKREIGVDRNIKERQEFRENGFIIYKLKYHIQSFKSSLRNEKLVKDKITTV